MAMKNKGGRPTDYRDEFIQKSYDYVKEKTGKEQMELPTVEGFAEYIGVSTDTINNWCDAKDENGKLKHPEFLGAIKDLKDKQKIQLMNDGLYGGKEVNSTMAIFLLKANHGLVETDRHEVKGEGFLINLNANNRFHEPGPVSTETT